MNILLIAFLLNFVFAAKTGIEADCGKIQSNEKLKKVYSSLEHQNKTLKLKLCGGVSAPKDFVYQQIQKYKEYTKINSFIDTVEVKDKKIFVNISILTFKLNPVLTWKRAPNSELHFHVVEGDFKGMRVRIKVVDLERRRSMVEMNTVYKYTKSSVPESILESGVKAVSLLLARNIQSWLDLEYKKQKKSQKDGGKE